MDILTAEQVRQWDQYTIDNEPIPSIDLMERAAATCTHWLEHHMGGLKKSYLIFCGKGNNGGDGLAIARMLSENGHDVNVFILEFGHKGTHDFQVNLARLHQSPVAGIHFIQSREQFPELTGRELIVDALYGTGLNRALEGVTEELVNFLNASHQAILSIDLPSGLFADRSSRGNTVVHARHTLSFQCYKPALLVAENANAIGEVHILDIGLHPAFPGKATTPYQWIDHSVASLLYRPRKRFSHKGNFGHTLLLAGSYGKMGAAVLAAKACVHAGSGLTTCCIPRCGYEIMQITVPEAMVITSGQDELTSSPDETDKYNVMALGPGIGTTENTKKLVAELCRTWKKPIVIDADGLNCLATQTSLAGLIPPNSIFTPHPREFDRLFGNCTNDFERLQRAIDKAQEHQCIIILKGHHTLVAMPGGQCYFNGTGNAGMAKGGSGDVLTGFIAGLMASGYTPDAAALLGVYLHGRAGDRAALICSAEAMSPSDIITQAGGVFLELASSSPKN